MVRVRVRIRVRVSVRVTSQCDSVQHETKETKEKTNIQRTRQQERLSFEFVVFSCIVSFVSVFVLPLSFPFLVFVYSGFV
jgi:hypothetical protein